MNIRLILRHRIFAGAILLMIGLLFALSGRPARADDATWFGRVWNNRELVGGPVATLQDANLDYNWGFGSLKPGIVSDDNFSIRWTRTVNMAPGYYRFFATMDDGMRVYLDNERIINAWNDSTEHTVTVDRYVSGGDHAFSVEYYDREGMASAHFSWQFLSGEGGGGGNFYPNWKTEYFNNNLLSGPPVVVQDQRYVNFDYGAGAPAPGVAADYWSARFTRQLPFGPGQYRLILTSDDGSRLYVNGALVIDNWALQPATTKSVDYFNSAGALNVVVEYFDAAGQALLGLDVIPISGGGGVLPPTPAPPPGFVVCPDPAPVGLIGQVISSYPLNVRLGTGTQFEVIHQLQPCEMVNLEGFRTAANDWVMVRLAGGARGWVNAKLLRFGVPIETLVPSG